MSVETKSSKNREHTECLGSKRSESVVRRTTRTVLNSKKKSDCCEKNSVS